VERHCGLQGAQVKVSGIHGDMDQYSRSSVLAAFKAGTTHVLVATDVAARGLDIRSVKVVVSYDVARSFESHVHRIGRTGRAGDTGGRAITLIMPNETRMAAAIAESLQAGGKPVPKCGPITSQKFCAEVLCRPLQSACPVRV
jgi:ATP-dependent RNA helicase DDX42